MQDACQRSLLARSVHSAWGEPARPGLPPEGETGKGAIKKNHAEAASFPLLKLRPGVTKFRCS